MRGKRVFPKMLRDEIRRTLNKATKRKIDAKTYRRLLALRMYTQGKTNREISEVTEFHAAYIPQLVSKCLKDGLESILTDKRTSNNYRMTYKEESEFLEQFNELAESGQLVTIKAILQKYEEVTGKPSASSTIYDLLKRHGWRKLRPRPSHPDKASDEEIASSKKLTKKSSNSNWQKTVEMDETSASDIRALN